jgi:hypothetical protein
LTVTDRDARSLYLDLIRRDLTRYGMRERMPVWWPLRRRLLLKTVNTLLPMLMGTSPFGQRKRDLGRVWPAEAETMIGMQRLTSLQRCVETVLADDIPGDLVECGVWRGGACILMRAVLAAYGDETRCGAVCAQLGERALVCSGWSDFTHVPHFDHVKVVSAVNFAATFPACRAVVHHGGAGTTAAGLRAGVPTLILWTLPDQRIWGAQVKRLKVGTARRFSTTTRESLVADLRRILAPQYVIRAREIAIRMTKPAASVAAAADLVENFARLRRVG